MKTSFELQSISPQHLGPKGSVASHSQSWLGSNKTTDAGVHAEGVFASHGLEQLVDMPTRGENTLDFILTDIHTSRF